MLYYVMLYYMIFILCYTILYYGILYYMLCYSMIYVIVLCYLCIITSLPPLWETHRKITKLWKGVPVLRWWCVVSPRRIPGVRDPQVGPYMYPLFAGSVRPAIPWGSGPTSCPESQVTLWHQDAKLFMHVNVSEWSSPSLTSTESGDSQAIPMRTIG